MNSFEKPTNHNCGISTGICGSVTFGTGKLDEYGYWKNPCPECAKAWKEQYNEDTWPNESKTHERD